MSKGTRARGLHLARALGLAALAGIPATSWASTPYPPAPGCSSPLVYCGGPIVSAPIVVEVSWNAPGPQGTVPAAVEDYLRAWWPAILGANAGYLAWLTEYNTVGLTGLDGQPGSGQAFAGYGTFAGIYRITPSPPNQGSQIDDTMIAAELATQIGAGALPVPIYDAQGHARTIYVIDFPPSVSTISVTFAGVTQQTCRAICGYHMGTIVGGQAIYYAVVPDLTTCGNCAPDGLQADLGLTHSHELVETITDPELFLESLSVSSTTCVRPGGWDQRATDCGEIADYCPSPTTVPTVTVGGQAFSVHGLYDNLRQDCETSGAVPCTSVTDCAPPAPLCDLSIHVCRACRPADCMGTTPACATSGPHAGACVVCADDSGCTADPHAPVCDPDANVCRRCIPGDCVALTPACATSGPNAGHCVQCGSSGDCNAPTPVCDPATSTCVKRGAGAGPDGPPDAATGVDAAHGVLVAYATGGDCGCRSVGTRSTRRVWGVPLVLLALLRRRWRRQGR